MKTQRFSFLYLTCILIRNINLSLRGLLGQLEVLYSSRFQLNTKCKKNNEIYLWMSFKFWSKLNQMVMRLFELMCRCNKVGINPEKLRWCMKSLQFLGQRFQIAYLNLSEHPIPSCGKLILTYFTNSSSPPLALLDHVSK